MNNRVTSDTTPQSTLLESSKAKKNTVRRPLFFLAFAGLAVMLISIIVLTASGVSAAHPQPSLSADAPANKCTAVVQERAAWPLNDQARVAITCEQIADFTKVRGVIALQLQADDHTQWFTEINNTYYSPWRFKNAPPPIPISTATASAQHVKPSHLTVVPAARVEYAPAGEGVRLRLAHSSSVWGQDQMWTATVPPDATGSVTFHVGPLALGNPAVATAPVVNGVATLTVAGNRLEPGQHSLTASYSGDGKYPAAQSSTAVLMVERAASPITLTTSSAVSPGGSPPTLTASLPSAATGQVSFVDQDQPGGDKELGRVPLVDGVAVLRNFTTPLALGEHHIFVTYNGDARHYPGESAHTIVTMYGLTSETTTPVLGQLLTVEAYFPRTATGEVKFTVRRAGVAYGIGTGELVDGKTEITVPTSDLGLGQLEVVGSVLDGAHRGLTTEPYKVTVIAPAG